MIDGVDGAPLGWTYLSVDSSDTTGAWELLWIGVTLPARATGVAAALLLDAEHISRQNGAVLLKVATSSTDATARSRAFYVKHGFVQVGIVPNFYGQHDDQVLFQKRL